MFCSLEVTNVMPLEAKLGEIAPKFVPEALDSALFGVAPFVKKSDIALPATYALLDAAKLSFLSELLETSGLRYDCLFKGKSAQEMRDLSPWLVELEPNHRLTRALFSNGDASGDLWHYNLGPIIRCAAEFKAVWRHLRRFVRLRRSDTPDWLYFRFWEEHVLSSLTCSVAQEPLDLAQALLAPIGDAPQSWILVDAGMHRATF